jgi:hypothetical protein
MMRDVCDLYRFTVSFITAAIAPRNLHNIASSIGKALQRFAALK